MNEEYYWPAPGLDDQHFYPEHTGAQMYFPFGPLPPSPPPGTTQTVEPKQKVHTPKFTPLKRTQEESERLLADRIEEVNSYKAIKKEDDEYIKGLWKRIHSAEARIADWQNWYSEGMKRDHPTDYWDAK